MAPHLLALVKWTGGTDDKKYTPGVPVEWIQGFDYEEFRSQKSDDIESHVIEWRDKPKKPPGGWPVFDGYVIEVSNRMNVLESKLAAIDGLLSPTRVMTQAPDKEGTTVISSKPNNDSNERSSKIKKNMNGKNIPSTIDNPRPSTSGKTAESSASGSRDVETTRRGAIAKRPPKKHEDTIESGDSSELENGQSSPESRTASSVSGCIPIGSKKSRTQLYKSTSKGKDGYKHVLQEIHKELKLLRKNRSKYDDVDISDSSEESLKEIGRKGSGVYITNDQWTAAKRARSYTAMGLNLLLSLFPMKTLLESNLRGGQNKISKENHGKKYKALDPKILEALYYTVNRQWKASFNAAGLGMAINNKLTRLRCADKKKVVDQEEPVDD